MSQKKKITNQQQRVDNKANNKNKTKISNKSTTPKITLLTLLFAIIALFFAFFFFYIGEEDSGIYLENELPILQTNLSNQTIETLHSLEYGIYSNPIRSNFKIDDSNLYEKYFRTKEWHYLSISTPSHFFGFAVFNAGYLRGGFCYSFDKKTKEKYEITQLFVPEISALFGFGKSQISNSSVNGSSEFNVYNKGSFSLLFDDQKNKWQVSVNISLSNQNQQMRRLIGNLEIEYDDSNNLILFYPYHDPSTEKRKSAYVHKNSGMIVHSTSSSLSFDSQSIDLSQATSSIDWTRSSPKRKTEWFWASASGYDRSTRIGINLSSKIYDTKHGLSQENAVWINGTRHIIRDRVQFTLPSTEVNLNKWFIKSTTDFNFEKVNSVYVDFEFQPYGSREEHLHLGLLVSEFIQPYGLLSGKIIIISDDLAKHEYQINEFLGVVETHTSVW